MQEHTQVGAAQRDMAEMAKVFGQVSERIGATWDNYRNRLEKIDANLVGSNSLRVLNWRQIAIPERGRRDIDSSSKKCS